MLRITQNQMEMFENHALTRTEFDIIDALLRHFDSGKRIAAAINFSIMENADRVRLVHQIVKIGVENGFRLQGELYALAGLGEECVH